MSDFVLGLSDPGWGQDDTDYDSDTESVLILSYDENDEEDNNDRTDILTLVGTVKVTMMTEMN